MAYDTNTLEGIPEPPENATPGRSIPKGFDGESRQYEPCYGDNVRTSITVQGSSFVTAIDEQKALSNMVLSIPVTYAEDHQSIDGQNGKERI